MSGWPLTVDKWPLLTSGPILRRVEPNSVSVFVALSDPRDVSLTIYDSNDALNGTILGSVVAPTVQIGPFLHVLVVTAIPTAPLTPGKVYGYNMSFDQRSGSNTARYGANPSLSALGLLTGSISLGYEDGKLPTFALPPAALADLRVVYASCRLAAGQGRDSFPVLDEMIMMSYSSPNVRPHEFFLIGDQIYADDVAPAVLAHASKIGDLALGWTEKIKVKDENGNLVDITTSDARLAPTKRNDTMKNAGFTSDDQDSHLVTLGEFIGMYLLAWSDALYLPEADGTLPSLDEIFSDPAHTDWAPLKDSAKSQYDKTYASAVATAKTTGAVRRALANVPTYMIFDDHEVTDDWYLDKTWRDAVEGKTGTENPFGLRVLSNALSAYAIFQAWGNDPDQFSGTTTPGGDLLAKLGQWQGDEAAAGSVAQAIRARLNLRAPAANPTGLVWHYQLLRPNYRVIFLDPRTQREDSKLASEGAALLGGTALKTQLTDRLAADARDLTIIVAQTPILGHHFVESLQRFLGFFGRPGKTYADYEAWSLNAKCFQDVLFQLSLPDHTVILSGDVHYGFAVTMDYWDERKPGPPRISRVVQLSASALKKEDTKTRVIGIASSAAKQAAADEWWAHIPILSFPLLSFLEWIQSALASDSSALAWEKPGRYLTSQGYTVKVGGEDSAVPAVREVPVGLFGPDGIATNPDWRYRIRFVSDDRSSATRRPSVAVPPTEQPSPAKSFLENVRDIGELHRFEFKWNLMRKIVGKNNIGDVSFVWTTADKRVRQSLWFTFDENILQSPMTIYDVPLAPPGAADPKPDLTTA